MDLGRPADIDRKLFVLFELTMRVKRPKLRGPNGPNGPNGSVGYRGAAGGAGREGREGREEREGRYGGYDDGEGGETRGAAGGAGVSGGGGRGTGAEAETMEVGCGWCKVLVADLCAADRTSTFEVPLLRFFASTRILGPSVPLWS